MAYNLLKTLHLLSIIVWVGGMFFAHFCLRPAVQQLAPPLRLPLMLNVLKRFFLIVSVAIVLVFTTGIGVIGMVMVNSGGGFSMPLDWNIMASLGLVMMGIFAYIYLGLFTRLETAVAAQDWPAGGAAMASIRQAVAVNLLLGVVVVCTTLML